MIDRYTKIVLTIIAGALVCIAFQMSVPRAEAERFGTQVMIGGIATSAAECLAGHISLTGGDKGNCVSQ